MRVIKYTIGIIMRPMARLSSMDTRATSISRKDPRHSQPQFAHCTLLSAKTNKKYMSRIGTCGCAAAEPEAIAGPEPLRYGSWHSGNDSPREGQHFRFDSSTPTIPESRCCLA